MKRLFLLFLLIAIVTLENVYADTCASSRKRELSNAAKYVKVNYEVKDLSLEKELEANGEKSTYKVPNYYFEISLYNMTEDMYATIYRTKDEHSFSAYHNETTDNVYTFYDYDTTEIDNYTITLRPSNDCQGLTLRTIHFTKPKYNAYSEFTFCQNSSNFYCQKFVKKDLNINNTQDFLNKIQVNNEKNKPVEERDPNEDIKELIEKNWQLYLCIFLGIIIVVLIVVVIIRKHNHDKRWKL